MIPYSGMRTYFENDSKSKNGLSSSSSTPTKPIYIVVWLDTNASNDSEIDQDKISQFQQVIDTIRPFMNIDECIDFITSMKDEKVFLIVSGDSGEQIVHLVQDLSALQSIYLLCDDQSKLKSQTQQCPKVKGAFTQIKYICDLLRNEIRRYDNYMTTVNTSSLIGPPVLGLNELDQSFMYSQLLKETLFAIEHDDRKAEMEELVAVFREQHVDTTLIDEFQREYTSDKAIYSYTKYYFIYSTLNKALRMQDINTIIKMGVFIRDLHQQISGLHTKHVDPSKSMTVYRGQAVSCTDFERMKMRRGGLLSFNNFLSTSLNYSVSCLFAESNSIAADMIGVLFQIEIASPLSNVSFANLGTISHYEEEKEILFSMNTIFRIDEIDRIREKLWFVTLKLTNESDEHLDRITNCLRQEIGEGIAWHRLGYLMIMLDEIDKAEEMYKKILQLDSDHQWKNLAPVYNQLGVIYDKKGDYKMALEYFQQAAGIEEILLSPDHLDLAITYNNIALMCSKLADYSTEYSFHQKALEIREKHLSSDDPLLAATYSNLAGYYHAIGNYSTARITSQKAIEMAEKSFVPNHPDLACIYNDAALMYRSMEEYRPALSLYEKALQIRKKIHPSNHLNLLMTYSQLGLVYDLLGEYSKAFPLHQHVLTILQETPYSNDLDIAFAKSNIGLTYSEMGDGKNALRFCQEACQIVETSILRNTPNLATVYNNMGQVYQSMGKLDEAHSYYMKALGIDEKCLARDHPDLAMTYEYLATVCQERKDLFRAREFCERALAIRENRFGPKHSLLAISYNNIGVIYLDEKQYPNAIINFKKAQKIHEESPIRKYLELAKVLNNIAATYFLMEEHSNALSFFGEALKIETEHLGPGHPDLAYTHSNIARAFEGLQRYEEAVHHIQEAMKIVKAFEPDDPRFQLVQNHHNIFLINRFASLAMQK